MMRMVHDAESAGNGRAVCRQHHRAEQTLYRWRRQLGGMEVAEAKRLRALERENAEVKRRVGDLLLDNRRLQAVLGKQW
jgi:putative transposase